MSISPALRFRILRRDRFRCHYCGAEPGERQLEIDHVWPRSKGGRDAEWNLVVACVACNRGKKAAELDESQVFEIQEVNRYLMDIRELWRDFTGLEIPDSMLWAFPILRRNFGPEPFLEGIHALGRGEARSNREAMQIAWRGFNAAIDAQNQGHAEELLG
jgi:hypothetical protein